MRTTVDIDEPVLREVKDLQKKVGVSLGRLMSDLLATALRTRRSEPHETSDPPQWVARGLGARVDLSDKEALNAAMDEASADGRIKSR